MNSIVMEIANVGLTLLIAVMAIWIINYLKGDI